ncbi:MAG: family 16 glycoside hydrolase, partial [Planctomycetota bacterium]
AAIANNISDKAHRADTVLAVFKDEKRIPVKCSLLRILGSIANEDALRTLQEALKDKNEQVQRTAIRELAAWPNTEAMPVLLKVLKSYSNESYRILAFRGYVRLVGLPSGRPIAETLVMYKEVLKFADNTEQKKLILAGLANVASPKALKIIQTYLDDTTVSSEAAVAIDKLIDNIESVALFDGKTFYGWQGNLETFRIENGAIVAGSLDGPNPESEYLCTTKQYGDFQLRVMAKLVGKGDNGGVQFRGGRVPNSNEMYGYQADMGSLPDKNKTNLWGCLYDASRHKLLVIVDQKKIAEVFKPNKWNEVVIRCLGMRIQIWVNGYQTVDYTEPDESIKQSGAIGLQVHKGLPTKVWYKGMRIKILDP